MTETPHHDLPPADSQTAEHLIERAALRLQGSRAGPANLLRGPAVILPAAAVADPKPEQPKTHFAGAAATATPQSAIKRYPITAATLAQAGMIDWSRSVGRLSDEFRIVQGQVLQAMAAKPTMPPALDNIIMITSARPGEGKTFSSLNLASSIASCSQRAVILVDLDIKRHTLTDGLGLGGQPGMLNLAYGDARSELDIIVPTAVSKLRVVPIGLPEPLGTTGGEKPLVTALEVFARMHSDSLIVIDTPPCLSSSEPSTLAPVVGHIVMIVEAQQTQRAEIEAALDLIDACPSVLLMLNKVQLTGNDTFGAYGY